MKLLAILCLFLVPATRSFAQGNHLPKDQRKSYKIMQSLCSYYAGKNYDTLQRNAVFNQFVYFDNILAGKSYAKKRVRINAFDKLFARAVHFIDSVGISNLDAKSPSSFKRDTVYYRPFAKKGFGGLGQFIPQALTYFDKRNPTKPIGTLFFEPRTHKLFAWIIIDQGGHYYPLQFNLF